MFFYSLNLAMKYRASQYAEVLWSALEGKTEAEQKKIIKRFGELLVRHQATGKTRAIYAAYEKLELRKQGMREVRLEMASLASDKLKKEIHGDLGKNIHIKEIVNPDIIGGIKILVDDEILIDASVKRQIESLFRK